jgi:hypothetical protein
MKTIAIALTGLLFSVLCAPPAWTAEPEAENNRPAERQTYESPVLSLILLPVNVLIKMASLFGPNEAAKKAAPPSSSSTDTVK